MGTIAEKLQNILDCKVDIASAISSKGIPCDKDGIFVEYADKIRAIETVEPDEPKVGDIRKEGIVVHIDPANPKRFLLMSKDEVEASWRTGSASQTKIDGLTLNDGKANCSLIYGLPEYITNPNEFPVFKAAKEYKDGKWFVASRDEFDYVFEYLFNWHRGDKMSWPDSMPDYDRADEIIASWVALGITEIDLSTFNGLYWVSSQWEVKPNFWGECDSANSQTGDSVTGANPTTVHHGRFFKWVEPEAPKTNTYGGYSKDPLWPDFTKELAEDAESYTYKAFMLFADTYNTVSFPAGCQFAITSDKQVYTGDIELGEEESTIGDISAVHTWDRTKDAKDSKGRVIRWIKFYGNTFFQAPRPQGILYTCANFGPLTTWSSNTTLLECVEQTVPINDISFDGPCLKCLIAPNIDEDGVISLSDLSVSGTTYFRWNYPFGIKVSKDTNVNLNTYPNSWDFIRTIIFDYPGVWASHLNMLKATKVVFGPKFTLASSDAIFNESKTLEELIIQSLDANMQASMAIGQFNSQSALSEVTIPNGWSGNLNIASGALSVSSLIRIMNALADKTGNTSGILTIGSTNMNKLSNEEKLIAINKNWTVS